MTTGSFFNSAGVRRNVVTDVEKARSYNPNFAEVLGAGFEAGLEAPGSFIEDRQAVQIARSRGEETGPILDAVGFFTGVGSPEEEKEEPLTREQYENSEFFREDVPFEEDMTPTQARLQATIKAREERRNFILGQAGGFEKAAGFASTLAGSMVDAKNLIVGTTVGVATAGTIPLAVGAARVAQSVGRGSTAALKSTRNLKRVAGVAPKSFSTLSFKAKTGVVAGEAALSTVPSIATGLNNEELTLSNYDVSDAFVDLAASTVFSVGLHAATRGAAQVFERIATPRDREAVVSVIESQIRNDEPVNAQPLIENINAENTPQYSTVDFNTEVPAVRRVEDGFEAEFVADSGVKRGTVGRGDTPDSAIENLRTQYRQPALNNDFVVANARPSLENITKIASDADRVVQSFDENAAVLQLAEARGAKTDVLKNRIQKVEQERAEVAEAQRTLAIAPDNTERKRAVTNAKNRLSRVKRQLEKVKNEQYRGDLERAQVQLEEARQRRNIAQDIAKELQLRPARSELQDFIRKQVPSENDTAEEMAARARDPFTRSLDLDGAERIVVEAGDLPDSTQARQQIETLIESDGTFDAELKNEIQDELADVDQARTRAQLLKNYKACKGSS